MASQGKRGPLSLHSWAAVLGSQADSLQTLVVWEIYRNDWGPPTQQDFQCLFTELGLAISELCGYWRFRNPVQAQVAKMAFCWGGRGWGVAYGMSGPERRLRFKTQCSGSSFICFVGHFQVPERLLVPPLYRERNGGLGSSVASPAWTGVCIWWVGCKTGGHRHMLSPTCAGLRSILWLQSCCLTPVLCLLTAIFFTLCT